MESKTTANKNKLYPVFLKLEKLELLLVGAGNVALEKLNSFLSNSPGANITIIAPYVKEGIRELLQNHPSCSLVQRSFEETDLENKDLVVLATDNPALHRQIKALAEKRGVLVNVADTPELCDFYLGSIVQKGNLKIAISTNGKSPTTAKRIREFLDNTIPDEVDELVNNLHQIRNKIKGDFAEKVKQLNAYTKTLVEKK